MVGLAALGIFQRFFPPPLVTSRVDSNNITFPKTMKGWGIHPLDKSLQEYRNHG